MDPAPDTADAEAPPAAASPRAERRMAALDDLGEMCLDVARELHGEILAAGAARREESAPDQPAPAPAPRRSIADLVLAFSRAARAVRLTFALQEHIEAAARAGQAAAQPPAPQGIRVTFVDSVHGVKSEPYAQGQRPVFEPADARRLQVGRTVRDLARASLLPGEHSPRDAREIVEHFGREAEARLEREGEFADLMARPLSETIAAICRDLDINPDWAALAGEDWARFELAAGPVGAPLAPFRRPETDDPPPWRPPSGASPHAAPPRSGPHPRAGPS